MRACLHSIFATNANRCALVVALFDTGVRRDERDMESGSPRNSRALLARVDHHDGAFCFGDGRSCRGSYGVLASGDTAVANALSRVLGWALGRELSFKFGLALAMSAIQA